MKKRMLAFALTLVMLLGMLPANVLADSSGTPDPGVVFTKDLEVDPTGNTPDRIRLEAYATGSVVTGTSKVPADIVLVLDQSGSMDESMNNSTKLSVMRNAVSEFVSDIAKMNDDNGDLYRVAIVGFASQSGYDDNTEILTASRTEEETSYEYVAISQGEMDKEKTYYIRLWGSYASITYRTRGTDGWYTRNGNNPIDLDDYTIYERTLVTETIEIPGVAYNDLKNADYVDALVNCTDLTIADDGTIGQAVAALDGNGATRTDLGMEMAQKIFEAQPSGTYTNRSKIVVLITDGVPTTQTSFSSTVANNAVDHAKDMKDSGAKIFSMYLGTPSSQSVSFLQACSSNYPDATAYNVLGSKAAETYYSAYTNADAIHSMFSGIASSITSNSTLNEQSVVRDILSEEFQLAADVSLHGTEQIEVYTVEKTANSWSDTEVPFETARVSIGGDDNKTISVTGFNFGAHCVTDAPKDGANGSDYGRKLVIYIPITEDPSSSSFGGWLKTNAGAYIYQDANAAEPVITATPAYNDATIRYSLTAAERAFHAGDNTVTSYTVPFLGEGGVAASVLDEMITKLPNSTNNAGVDMEYKLYEIGTSGSAPEGGETDTGDDHLVASLSVPATQKPDVTDPDNWTWVDENPEAVLIFAEGSLMAEKVYVLVCKLTSIEPVQAGETQDSLTVYAYLDLAAVRDKQTHIVYGEIDAGGVTSVPATAPGSLVGNTYTEAVSEGNDSVVMTFIPLTGYRISKITRFDTTSQPLDTPTVIYPGSVELADDGSWSFQAKNVTKGVAVEVDTERITHTLTTADDAGSEIIAGMTYNHEAATMNVPFQTLRGYYLTELTINETAYNLTTADGRAAAEEAGAVLVTEKDATNNDVVVGGHAVVSKTQDNYVAVKSAGRLYNVTLKYLKENSEGKYVVVETEGPTVVAYGILIGAAETPKYAAGTVQEFDGHNYSLSEWYTVKNELIDFDTATMPAEDLTIYALWSKKPDVKVATVTVEKAVVGTHEADTDFDFVAVFHEQEKGSAKITIPADSDASVTAQMEIIMTDRQAEEFKNGNGSVRIYEVIPENANDGWLYDETVYELRWIEQDVTAGQAVLFRDGEPLMNQTAIFTNERTRSDVELTKEADKQTTSAGQTITYTVTVENTGNVPLENLVVTDTMTGANGQITFNASENSGVTYDAAKNQFTIASLAVGEEKEITYTYVVQTSDEGNQLSNKVEALGETKEITVTVEKQSVALTKTVSKSQAEIGDVLTYIISVTNTGNVTLTDVAITDTMTGADIADIVLGENSANVTYNNGVFTVAALAVDATETITYTYTVTEADAGKTISNAVVNELDDDEEDNETETKVEDPVEKVTMSKSVKVLKSGATAAEEITAPVQVGDVLVYTITVKNTGNVTQTGLKIEDSLAGITYTGSDANVTYDAANRVFTVASLAPEATQTIEYTYTVAAADAGKTITNGVTVNVPDETDGDDETETKVEKQSVALTKTVSKSQAEIGDVLTYTITVTNTGNVALTNVAIKDTMTGADIDDIVLGENSANVTYNNGVFTVAALAVGATETITYTYTVTEADAGKTITNGVTVNVPDGTEDDDETETEVEKQSVALSKTVDKAEAKVGDELTYTITVTNTGNVPLENLKVKDSLPGIVYNGNHQNVTYADGIFTISALDEEETISFTYNYTVQAADEGEKLKNTVIALDEKAEVEVPIDPVDRGITVDKKAYAVNGKTTNSFTVKSGDVVTWTLTVKNTGNVKLEDVTISDLLTAGGKERTLTVYDGMGENAAAVTRFDLEIGQVRTFYVSYTAAAEDAGKVLQNLVTVVGTDKDEDPTNDPQDSDTNREVKVEQPAISGGHRPALNKEDHVAYVIGYEDMTVRPQNNITRAEVATIFFRLLTDESRAYFWSQTNSFTDVAADSWYNNAVSTMSKAGIITGYPDGSFRPNAPITRAEFAAIAARFSDVAYGGKSRFTDVQNHWANEEIALAEHLGWITGYPDNTFKPDQNITRAEAMTLINRVLERAVEEEHMLPDMVKWIDNKPEAWYYEAVQEATNSHIYTRIDKVVPGQDFCYEDWIKILTPPDWAALEKSWSDANDH